MNASASRPLAGLLAAALSLTAAGCGGGSSGPSELDPRQAMCRSCRMPVSDPRLAAQLTAPGEETLFFDDIGCLRDYLAASAGLATSAGPATSGARLPAGSRAWVADHRSRAWVSAPSALYERCPGVETPMASHLIAHADRASRDADRESAGCVEILPSAIFGSRLPSAGGGR